MLFLTSLLFEYIEFLLCHDPKRTRLTDVFQLKILIFRRRIENSRSNNSSDFPAVVDQIAMLFYRKKIEEAFKNDQVFMFIFRAEKCNKFWTAASFKGTISKFKSSPVIFKTDGRMTPIVQFKIYFLAVFFCCFQINKTPTLPK